MILGQTYCLAHLNPFQLTIPSQRVRRDLRIHVRFTNHAFTAGYDAATHSPGHPIIQDHGGRPRSFCEVRYALSHTLPGVLAGFTHPATKVHQTAAQRNWAHVTQIETPKGPYYVFFELRRAPRGSTSAGSEPGCRERVSARPGYAGSSAVRADGVWLTVLEGVRGRAGFDETVARNEKRRHRRPLRILRSRHHLRAALRDYGFRRWGVLYLIWSVTPMRAVLRNSGRDAR